MTDRTTEFQHRMWHYALTGLSLMTLLLLVLALLAGLGTLFLLLEPVLLPLVIAGVLAYLLIPLVAWVQRCVKKRVIAVLLVMAAAAALLAGFGVAIIPQIVRQTGDLMEHREQMTRRVLDEVHEITETNSLVVRGIDMLHEKTLKDARAEGLHAEDYAKLAAADTGTEKLAAVLSANSSYLTERLWGWFSAGTHALSGIGMVIIGTVMVPVFLFYFLLESESIAKNWHTLLPLRASAFREELVETVRQINDYIISFVRGQMLVSLIDGALLAIALKCLGVPYAFTLGTAAALLGIIPYIGMISTWIPAILITWFHFENPLMLLYVSLVFVCVSQLDGWVIQPKIVGSRLRMHDMTVMFSVLFWSYVIGGVVGALLAVPLTASLKVLFMRYIWCRGK